MSAIGFLFVDIDGKAIGPAEPIAIPSGWSIEIVESQASPDDDFEPADDDFEPADGDFEPADGDASGEAMPISFVGGKWTAGKSDDAQAVVLWDPEPDPETGIVGWCWWACGRVGDAPSLKEAMAKAEEVVRSEAALGGAK